MTNPLLRRLFTPIVINALELPNRVLMNGLHLGMEKRADPFAGLAHFFRLPARGEVGLLMAGGCSPDAIGRPMPGGLSIESDDLIAEHRRITSAVHAEGGRIALQLVHFGREAFHPDIVSASSIRAPNNVFRPKAMTDDEIDACIAAFGEATRRAREAGYDAVEIVGSQGFLLHQFLANTCNRRSDRWGGDIEDRLAFPRAVLRAVRHGGGADFPVIFRLPSLDLTHGGNAVDDVLEIVRMAREETADLINVGIGTHESRVPTISMTVPRGGFALVARWIREHAGDVPVAVSNRINDPRIAEEMLAAGVADMVAVGRPLLADPAFVAKARRDDFDGINTCIACNQACLDKALFGGEVGCTVNPDACLETEGELPPVTAPRRIAVVGGGVAGMTAAITLARRGHRVALFERSTRLGGQLRLGARVHGKEEFLETVRWGSEMLVRLGVELRLGRAVTAADLAAEGWDHVVVATGNVARPLDIATDGSVPILSYEDVLTHDLPVAHPAVVIGGGGIALDVALHLASRRSVLAGSDDYVRRHVSSETMETLREAARAARPVTILQRSEGRLAAKVGATTHWALMGELDGLGVEIVKGAVPHAVENGAVTYDLRSGQRRTHAAGIVVVAIGQEIEASLDRAQAESGRSHSVIGGANPANAGNVNITRSVRDAFDTACAL